MEEKLKTTKVKVQKRLKKNINESAFLKLLLIFSCQVLTDEHILRTSSLLGEMYLHRKFIILYFKSQKKRYDFLIALEPPLFFFMYKNDRDSGQVEINNQLLVYEFGKRRVA